MKFTIKIANVYDTILEETKKELVVIKDRKTYIGALFFRKEETEVVKKVFDRVDIDGSAFDAMIAAYHLMKKHDRIAKDDKTLKTMMHWQYVNGLTDEMLLDGYKFKNDTELLENI